MTRKSKSTPNQVSSSYNKASIRLNSGNRRSYGIVANLAKQRYRPDLRPVSLHSLFTRYTPFSFRYFSYRIYVRTHPTSLSFERRNERLGVDMNAKTIPTFCTERSSRANGVVSRRYRMSSNIIAMTIADSETPTILLFCFFTTSLVLANVGDDVDLVKIPIGRHCTCLGSPCCTKEEGNHQGSTRPRKEGSWFEEGKGTQGA